MRRVLIMIVILLLIPIPVSAAEVEPPEPGGRGEKYMPDNTESFTEGLWSIVQDGITLIEPAVAEAASICGSLIVSIILLSLVQNFTENDHIHQFIGTILVAIIMLRSSNSLIELAADTVKEVSDYGKLLIPVMMGAMTAQGSAASSAALYTGTVVFDSVLSTLISAVLTPMVYIYLVLSIGNSATGESALSSLRDFVKWLMTWCLKIVLYVFTGYMGITKVVSGSADAAALKATKITISGMVPVVGGIISDASESILVSAQLVKNSLGVYGLLAIGAIWVEPFIKIGVQYILLKCTAAVCGLFGMKRPVSLIKNFSTAMGFLLAMTGAVCLMLLISIVCFMKGVS